MNQLFTEWRKQKHAGNYVSVDVLGLPTDLIKGVDGSINRSPHITLMYSPKTSILPEKIDSVLKNFDVSGKYGTVVSSEVFDSPSKDGEQDKKLGCIVLKVNMPELDKIHQSLKDAGCKHTYDDFTPHATLMYNVPIDQAKSAVDTINKNLGVVKLKLGKFNNEPIDKDWENK